MLSLHPNPDKLRAARNLLPRADGSLYTRPGAVQVVEGRIGRAVGWGNRVVMEKNGRIVLWDGTGTDHDLGAVGYTLQAVPFQAYDGDGNREDRLYVADGMNPLWYAKQVGGTYARTTVVNTVLDGDDNPYPIPVPFCVANWRGRLWIGDGTNRVYHCQNERPEQWDPLWALDFQGVGPDNVRLIRAHGETLLVGLTNSLWSITGTTQYNWQRDELFRGLGVSGGDAAAGDGIAFYFSDTTGIYALGSSLPLSEDLRQAFRSLPVSTSLCVDQNRRLLFAVVAGTPFVMHMDAPGDFTELHGYGVNGVVVTDALAGWYGEDGLWLFGQDNLQDARKDGTTAAVVTLWDSWDQRPNEGGNGRALLDRTVLTVSGPGPNEALYHAIAYCDDDATEGLEFFKHFALSPSTGDYADLPTGTWNPHPYKQVRREFSPKIAGMSFRHIVRSTGHIEIHNFAPKYRFGLPKR
jgi:hypothetical protein